jgi:hypothetical protein
MGRRIYQTAVPTALNMSGSSPIDFWTIKSSASNGIQLHWTQITAAGITGTGQVALTLQRYTAGSTSAALGSGGTAPAIYPIDDGDSRASSSVVHFNDSATRATNGTGGATTPSKPFNWNVLLPFDYMPGPEDEDRDACFINEIIGLIAPAGLAISGASGSPTCTGFLTWHEYP